MQEQRNYIRYDVEGSVSLKPQDNSSRMIKAYLLNLSYDGLSVSANEKIEEGSIVDFELIIKLWAEPIIGKGKVKSAQEIKRYEGSIFRLGIEFDNIDKDSIKIVLNQVVSSICEEKRKERK
ncbi:MAG: hypothetical protein DRP74_07085 [Candidatus Omnitrophota bacterium]|nr:MAG: hypothetical protein DRP74_07085 [Candidatus Omnitrophota bacterium]